MYNKALVYRIHQNLFMVLFTPEKLTFKGSKKQHQILAQTAYYQAGKIVVQTILPEQPPVALITLNTPGTTCSTSADIYIPIENIFNTQSCSSLESRLVSLYGGKAASLLVEYEQRLRFLNKNNNSSNDSSMNFSRALQIKDLYTREKILSFNFNNSGPNKKGLTEQKSPFQTSSLVKALLFQQNQKLTKQKTGKRSETSTETKLINNVQSQIFDLSELTLLSNKKWKSNGKAHLIRTCFAGAGNNIFQSTLGNIEIQTATRLAKIMVNYWNFYSLNKISLYSLFKKYAPAHNLINKLANFNDSSNGSSMNFSRALQIKDLYAKERTIQPVNTTPYPIPALLPLQGIKGKEFLRGQQFRDQKQKNLYYTLKEESVAKELEAEGLRRSQRKCNVRVWGIKLKVKDKTPQGNIIYKYKVAKRWNNLYFAIAQSKNSLKICENKNFSYNIQRLSSENIGNYSQLNNNNFQLINSLQFSHLQRDRFYPNWFRLYLPDMEATEFLNTVANYYFSLGLQTLTFPSTKSSYYFTPALGKLQVSTASPFLTFLNKNTQKEKYKFNSIPFLQTPSLATLVPCKGKGLSASTQLSFKQSKRIPNISPYAYCSPSILINSTSAKFINSRNKLTLYNKLTSYDKSSICKEYSKARGIKDPSFTKVTKDQFDSLNVPFSLLLENQIFPLNYNSFSIVEKELLYNALVNSSFAKAFYLINQNRQLLDFFVDYLLRFQILRQHQILYLFSTLLLGCNKTA